MILKLAKVLSAVMLVACGDQSPATAQTEPLWHALADQWPDMSQGCRLQWMRVNVLEQDDALVLSPGQHLVMMPEGGDDVETCEGLAHQMLHIQHDCVDGGHDYEHEDESVWQRPHQAGGQSLEAWSRRFCRSGKWRVR
jgi:hypothetical protein